MSEQVPQSAEEPFVLPDLPDDEAISLLYPDRAQQEEPAPEQSATSDPEPTGVPQTRDEMADRINAVERALENLPTLISQGLQNVVRPQTSTPQRTALDQMKEENAGVDPTQLEWLAKAVRPLLNEVVSPLVQEVQLIKGATIQTVQERIRSDFDTHVDRQLTALGVDPDDEFTRSALRARVILDGQNTPGFTKDHATALLRKYNAERLGTSQSTAQYVRDKQKQEEEAPPIAHSSGAATATPGIRKALTDPKNKRMNFRGQDFEKLVTTSLQAALGGKPTRR
jgi:hypothetical protein